MTNEEFRVIQAAIAYAEGTYPDGVDLMTELRAAVEALTGKPLPYQLDDDDE